MTLAVVALFALLGGEYNLFNLWELKRLAAAEEAAIPVLEGEVDSLAAELTAIETDPAVQERIARERYGMLQAGEFMYRIERDAPER